jgi:hypothetical protein
MLFEVHFVVHASSARGRQQEGNAGNATRRVSTVLALDGSETCKAEFSERGETAAVR